MTLSARVVGLNYEELKFMMKVLNEEHSYARTWPSNQVTLLDLLRYTLIVFMKFSNSHGVCWNFESSRGVLWNLLFIPPPPPHPSFPFVLFPFSSFLSFPLTWLQLSEQVDLIIWMRSAVLPTFRKLYGKIEVDLQRNDKITVEIENNYNTYSFGGKKILVLSTASWLGGKNNFMGITYLSFGFLSLLFAGGFIFLYMHKPR